MAKETRERDFGKTLINSLAAAVVFYTGIMAYVTYSDMRSRQIAIECAKPIARQVVIPKDYQEAFLREDGQIQLSGYQYNPYRK